MQVLNASSCETSSLPEGANDITADYLGDAAYGSVGIGVGRRHRGLGAGRTGTSLHSPGGDGLPRGLGAAPAGDQADPGQPGVERAPVVQQRIGPLALGRPRLPELVAPTPTATLEKVLANGATPMIDWRCGPSDATILSGQDDALITSFATELAQLKAPVFLRWFYEFNFPNSPDYKACIGKLGPAGYAAAFRHIHALFTAAGASNVSFVWCIASGGQDRDWIKYYPGPAYVDWIAVDGYLRNSTTYQAGQFAQLFGSWYSTFDSFGKPMMITETAALAGAQGPYLSDVKQSLDNGYPMIRGVLYFDAPGKGGTYHYPLDNSGYSAFQSLANDRHFQPPQEPSTTSVTVSTSSAAPAEAVHISASCRLRLRRLGEPLQQRVPRRRLPADARGHQPGLHDGQPPRRQRHADGRLQRRRRIWKVGQRPGPGPVGAVVRRRPLGPNATAAVRRAAAPPAQPPAHTPASDSRFPGDDQRHRRDTERARPLGSHLRA